MSKTFPRPHGGLCSAIQVTAIFCAVAAPSVTDPELVSFLNYSGEFLLWASTIMWAIFAYSHVMDRQIASLYKRYDNWQIWVSVFLVSFFGMLGAIFMLGSFRMTDRKWGFGLNATAAYQTG